MKLVIKIFDILTLIASIVAVIFVAFMGIYSLAATDAVLKQAGTDATVTADGVKALGVFLLIVAVYYLFTAALCIVTLKKIKNPMQKKPIALGVLNILFCNLISGICLLCWSDYDKE